MERIIQNLFSIIWCYVNFKLPLGYIPLGSSAFLENFSALVKKNCVIETRIAICYGERVIIILTCQLLLLDLE